MALKLLCRKHNYIFQHLLKTHSSLRSASDGNRGQSIYKNEETKKIRFFVLNRYLEYMKNYDKYLTKKFPTAMTIYKLFTDGVKTFYTDAKEFVKIVKIINSSGNSIKSLTRREMELYDQMPKDMFKIAPVLVVATLPFANYVIFPLIYMFPKQILTSHFWSPEQRKQFTAEKVDARMQNNPNIIFFMQSYTAHGDNDFRIWQNLLQEIQFGKSPDIKEMLRFKKYFSHRPYNIDNLSRNHVRHLLKLHDLHMGFFRRVRLGDRALVLKAMDHAILMEGGVHNLQQDALRNACSIRGLNPNHCTDEYLISWLRRWMQISAAVDSSSLSLILHAPILLGYNGKYIKLK